MWRKENPVLTVALFTTVKIQKRPKCPWMEEWIKKMWYIHRIFLSHKKKPMKSSMKLRSGSLGGKKKAKWINLQPESSWEKKRQRVQISKIRNEKGEVVRGHHRNTKDHERPLQATLQIKPDSLEERTDS